MTLDRQTEDRVIASVLSVCKTAEELRSCEDLDAMKAVLNRVWFAVNKASHTIIDAENAARRAALAKLGPEYVT